jgi:predicted DNA-binding WGR domain protein
MERQEFHYTDERSNKFWAITQKSHTLVVEFGRVGSQGQKQIKELGSRAEAEKTADKLINAKLKKGYVKVSGDATKGPEPSKTKKTKKTKETEAPENNKQPGSKEVKATIALAPEDWLWATWRPRRPVARPEPAPFDLEGCLARVARVKPVPGTYGRNWNWKVAGIAPALTREEAQFWLVAMTSIAEDKKGKALVQPLSKKKYTGKVELKQVTAAIKKRHVVTPELLIPLASLLTFKELLGLITDRKLMASEWYITDRFLTGFQRHVLPFLGEKELSQLAKAIKGKLSPKSWPADFYERPDIAFHLAAAVPGFHDELLAVVQSWRDDLYQGDDWLDHYHKPQYVILGLGSAELVDSHMRRMKLRLREPAHIRAWLAHTETAALDFARQSVLAATNKKDAEELCRTFALVQAPAAAPHMLALKLSSKAPSVAREWLEQHAEHAVAGLVPTAAERGRLADAAVELLRERKRRGDAALIEEALEAATGDVAQRVTALVLEHEERTFTPFDDGSTPAWLKKGLEPPKKTPKLPGWVDPADLPPVAVGEARLNDEQVAALLAVLQTSTLEEPAPFLAQLKQKGDAETLDAFAWKLFELWLVEGGPAKEKWALLAVGHLGGDPSALKLTPLVRAWPGESQHQRAVLGLGCLRSIGTDTALMQLNGIAQKLKFKALKQRAMEAMEAIAAGRGMTRAELEDRIVPDCDLDERGSRTFDFGPRSFRFVLGPGMKPMVRDEKGKVRPNLPKPGKGDDADRAAAAEAAWKLLKKQIREVVKIQAVRLEQAMVTGRRWPVKEFEALLVRHPLMINLVRLVVWGAYRGGELAATFRVTEDQGYADEKDEAFTLEKKKTDEVGIVHPYHLSEPLRAAWGQVFGDYELVPPFLQLGRPIHGLEKGEATKKELDRFKGAMIPAVSLVGALEKQGWVRGIPEDAGIFGEHSKPFYGAGVTAIVQYPGVPVGYMVDWEDQEIERCFFLKGIYTPEVYPDHKKALPLGKVDPVAMSEVLTDLTLVASKAR